MGVAKKEDFQEEKGSPHVQCSREMQYEKDLKVPVGCGSVRVLEPRKNFSWAALK